jgi:alcohol dehydrogenase class IV
MSLKLRNLGFDLAYAEEVGAVALKQQRTQINPTPLTPKTIADLYRACY